MAEDVLSENPYRILVPFGSGRALAPSGTGLLLSGQGCVTYLQAKETAGSTAGFSITDGTSNNGLFLFDYNFSANQSTSEMFGLHWVQFVEGLYVTSNSGTFAGAVVAWVNHDCSSYNGALFHMAQLARIELELRIREHGWAQ